MHRRHGTLGRALASCAVPLMFGGLAACEFEHGFKCDDLEELPTTPLTKQGVSIYINAPDTLQAVHGFGCSGLNRGGFLKVEQSVTFPPFVTSATVLLNGFQLAYVDTDHHVAFVGTTIGKIGLERNTLRWNAIAKLAEDGSDEPYTWCYRFTAVGWNDAQLSAVVDHDDALDFCTNAQGSRDNFYIAQNDFAHTALAAFRSFVQNDAFIGSRTIAVLPRGFGISWPNDHHLLQLAYNLDHADAFVEHKRHYYKAEKSVQLDLPNGAHRVGAGYVAYQTYAILKDNRARRDWGFGEIVSAMGGADVHVVQPPFAILPQTPSGGLVGDAKDESVTIENVPYEFAIPMLTGWDLGYGNDQHVKEVGAWIDELQWVKAQGAPAGTLRYTFSSRLADKDGNPGHYARHKVNILGLKAAQGRLPGGPAALPAEPAPTAPEPAPPVSPAPPP